MSYQTLYTLTWDDVLPEPMIADIVKAWRSEDGERRTAIDEDGSSEEPCCWYECERDLKDLSLRAPDVLFTLTCRGEDFTVWRLVAKAGQLIRIPATLLFHATFLSPEARIPS